MSNESRTVAGADWAFVRDSAALVFVSEFQGIFRVEYERVWIPGAKPLRPGVVFRQAMKEIEDRDAECMCCDDHYLASVIEVTEDHDVELVRFPIDAKRIAEAFVRVRVLLGAHRVDMSLASSELVTELKEVTGKPLAGGVLSIGHVRRPGSHGDRARAFVSALFALELAGAVTLNSGAALTGGKRRMAREARTGDNVRPGYMADLPPRR